MKIAGNNCPIRPSNIAKIRAAELVAVISPYPMVVNVTKLKYVSCFKASSF